MKVEVQRRQKTKTLVKQYAWLKDTEPDESGKIIVACRLLVNAKEIEDALAYKAEMSNLPPSKVKATIKSTPTADVGMWEEL